MRPTDQRQTVRLPSTLRLLQASFVLAVICFAWLRFSDNTVDNDLWGHVLYGQRYWLQGQVRCKEMLSWTARGYEIINHEYLAEIVMGLVHRAAGGPGLWLYMMAMGIVTVALAFRVGRGPGRAQQWTALALLAASINFIALGFAVRPQLFTTLALVMELAWLLKITNGRLWWGLLFPPLFVLWGNLHGGVLAGILVLFVLAGVESVRALWPHPLGPGWDEIRPPRRNLLVYWSLFFTAVASLGLTPWGYGLVRWNIQAVLLDRVQTLVGQDTDRALERTVAI